MSPSGSYAVLVNEAFGQPESQSPQEEKERSASFSPKAGKVERSQIEKITEKARLAQQEGGISAAFARQIQEQFIGL